ncbi:hypothetical protein IJJ18_01560 [Candidatus Saccharibacteria bacterium]|nr:hypothetical protein [Candidatus Saccharibacteria bacterium]
MNGQSNTNDLQKAIDEITGGSSDLETQIKGQMGVPPVPPTAGAGVPEMPTASAPASAPASADTSSDVAPIPDFTAKSSAPAAAEVKPASVGGDLAKVRESALQELVPLMDKVNLSSQEKFDIYTEVIENTKDKSIVEKAFEAAKSIEDEKVKAESLLKLVQMIDTL